MDAGILVPLAAFAGVVIIVGLVNFSAIRDREIAAMNFLQLQETEHRFRIAELDRELQQVKKAEQPGA